MSNYPPANDDEAINKAMAKVIVAILLILLVIAGCHSLTNAP